MTTVELFGFAPSTYVRTARLVCEEKGIDYALLPLEFRADSHRDLHPYLRMPALLHGDVCLFETLAIATYLNETFPGPDLAAPAGIARATMFQWISASCDYLYPAIVAQFAKSDTVDASALSDALDCLKPVQQALSDSAYLAGTRLTLADLFLAPTLLYAGQSVGDSSWLSGLPDIANWLDRLRQRQSVVNTEG